MTLRVAYIVSRFPHLPETFILREMNALEAQGIKVELFPLVVQNQTLVHAEGQAWLEKLHRTRVFSGKCICANVRMLFRQPGRYFGTFFQMVWFNLSSPKFLLRALFIFPAAVEMAEEMRTLDIKHIHAHYATHPALTAWIISRFTGIPFSISVHAHDIFVNRSMLKQKLQRAVFIRAISEFNKNFLAVRYGQDIDRKIVVIHCGIIPDWYLRQPGDDSKDFQIISVGSLQAYKGHKFLVRACGLLKEQGFPFHCRIVGDGELQKELSVLIESLDLSEKVDLVGPKTEEEVAELLAQSDCFVLPSIITRTGKMEGIPVVLMEALASQLPVIASDISGIPELVQHQVSGILVPPEDTAKIAGQIIWVHDHPQESAEMAANGRKIVLNEFDLKKNTLDLANLFIQFQYQKK